MLAKTSMRIAARPVPSIVTPLRPLAPRRVLTVTAVSAVDGQVKLYVGNLSWQATQDDLFELFGKYGQVSDVFLPVDRESGRPRGFGFVTLDAQAAQESINQVNGLNFMGREIRVNEAQDRDAPRSERSFGRSEDRPERTERPPRPALDENQARLYIGNLSWETTRDDLVEYFGRFGTVHNVNVPVDRETGRPRGFAFVTIDATSVGDAIRESDGVEFMGRALRVNEAQEQTDAPRGGRGGGRGDGFRGGRGGDGFRGGRGGGRGGFRGGRGDY